MPTADIYNIEDTIPKVLWLGLGHKVSGSSYMKPHYGITDRDKSIEYNLPVITWTVNDEETAKSMLQIPRMKGLIGNNPEILAKVRANFKKK